MTLEELDLNGTYTYADYLKWNFEVIGIPQRIELIKGKIFKMSPAQARKHQESLRFIFSKLDRFLDKSPCRLYTAPFDVRLTPRKDDKRNKIHTIVQPDLCVICDLDKLDDAGCVGAPDLIVEILSPGNSRKEMKEKFEVYEENGVKEYWLVYPFDEYVMVYTLNEKGKFIGSKPLVEGEFIQSTVLPGLEIEVGEVFKY